MQPGGELPQLAIAVASLTKDGKTGAWNRDRSGERAVKLIHSPGGSDPEKGQKDQFDPFHGTGLS
jgi:hypothetical protein